MRAALQEQRACLMREGLRCRRIVDGYNDFVFLNRFGDPLHYGAINKAIVRVVRDCNIDALDRFARMLCCCRTSARIPSGTRSPPG